MGSRFSASEFAIGAILGTAVGLAIGFLFAPLPGRKARELVKGKATDIPETVKELTADRKKVYRETWAQRRGLPRVSDTYFQ